MPQNRPFLYAARQFVVWREGSAVNWETSYPALAKATSLPEDVVRHICRKQGWSGKMSAHRDTEAQQLSGESVPTVDVMLRLPASSPTRQAYCY